MDGIKRIASVATENKGNVTLELEEYADPTDVYNEVRDEVGRLIDFSTTKCRKCYYKKG